MISPSQAALELDRQLLPRPCDARHHGADRQIEHRRDVLVRKVLDLAQNEDLARLGRQGRQRRRDLAPPVAGQRALLWIRTFGGTGLEHLQRKLFRPVALPEVDPGIAHNAQQPWPRLLATKRAEIAQCQHHPFLRQTLLIPRIARQPSPLPTACIASRPPTPPNSPDPTPPLI